MRKTRMALAFAVLIAAASVGTRSCMAPELDAQARARLLRAGDAQMFVKLPLGTMHVRMDGPADGPVVLLVHGAFVGGAAFEQWIRPLASAGYRVIAPDLLGYGYSDRPRGRYDRDFYAMQLAQLLDALKVEKPVHFAGASMGGAVVAAFAQRHPEMLRSVTLMAPTGAGGESFVFQPLLWPIMGDLAFRAFGRRNLQELMHDTYEKSTDRDRLDRWMRERTRFRGFNAGVLKTLRHFDAHWMPDAYQAIGNAGVPTMALWGTEDTVNDFDESKVLSEWVPQLHVVPVEGHGHAMTVDELQTLVGALLPFLRRAEEAGLAGAIRIDHREIVKQGA